MYSSGYASVRFDPAVEARLRLKIDLYVMPTVCMLYLFCFIDRANIGIYIPAHILLLHPGFVTLANLKNSKTRQRKASKL